MGGINLTAPSPAMSGGANLAQGPTGGIDLNAGPGNSVAPNNPVTAALNGTQKLVGDVAQTGNVNDLTQAQNIAAGKTGHSGSWFSDFVRALDLPRAAVVSGVDTALHGGGFSQWLQGTENHETAGHLLNDLGIHNHIVDSLGGILGDVALDPLTYLGGLGELGRGAAVTGRVADALSAAEAAAKGVGDAGKAAAMVGRDAAGKAILTPDTLVRLHTQGLGGLTNTERTFLEQAHPELGSLGTGLGVRVPGSKLAGNPTYVPLVHAEGVTSALKGLTNRLADTKAGNWLGEHVVGGLHNDIRSAALNGEGDRLLALSQIQRHAPVAAGIARDMVNHYGQEFTAAKNAIPSEVHDLVIPAMEGDQSAQDAIRAAGGGDGLAHLQNTYAEIRQVAAAKGVPIGKIEDYFPHQLTSEARDLFAKRGGGVSTRNAFGNALQRKYVANPTKAQLADGATDTFLGQKLQTGGIDELNQIAHDVYGKDAVDLFRSDPWTVTNNYLHGIAKRVGQQHLANKLDALGVTVRGDVARTPEEWQRMLNAEKVSQAVKGTTASQIASKAPEAGLESSPSSGSPLVSLGSTGANAGRSGPDYVKEALQKLADQQSQAVKGGKLGSWYDKTLNVWKQYALAMPGKALRHTVANPAWAMYIGNVSPSNMGDAFRAWRAYQRGGLQAVTDPAVRDEIKTFVEQGVSHGHEFHPQDLTGPQTRVAKLNAAVHNPLSTKGGYFRKNQDFQRAAQDYSRFAMFHDAMQKGYAAPEAAAKVRQFLGDPHNITNFERATARRAIPFYTFLRQNMPTELRAAALEPGKFVNAYQAPKQEIEQNSSPQGIVPQYFKDTMSVRLPWQIGGNQVYLSPDLPFTRIGQLTSGKNQFVSNTSPLIQDAIGAFENTNTFTGQPFSPTAKQAPGAWSHIPGLMEALHAIAPNAVLKTTKASTDYGQTTPAGQWVITPKAETMIESLMPLLGQARRAVPTEPNMKARGDTTLLADLLGQNFRTNDPSQQAGELYARQAALKQLIEQLQNQGELPKYIAGFHP